MKKTYHSRKFLNKTNGLAAIEASGSFSNYSIDFSIAFSDCSRKVELEFYMYDNKSIKERMEKLDLLISELNKARDWLKEAVPVYVDLRDSNSRKKPKAIKVTEVTLDDLQS